MFGNSIIMAVVFEWDFPQAHVWVMVMCPYVVYTVYIPSPHLGVMVAGPVRGALRSLKVKIFSLAVPEVNHI